MIRWIDDINGIDSNQLYDEVANIRRKIKRIKNEESSVENSSKLKLLYARLNELQFIPEYLLLIIEDNKDYLRACKGFTLNGRNYKRLVSTSNGVKMSVIVFASDEGSSGNVMRDELKRRMENGRDMTKTFVPAKLEAYRSLACSASLVVSDPRGVLVVPDVITHFKADFISLKDNPDGSGVPLYKEETNEECENNASDGYGIISPRLIEAWSEELGLAETTSAVCVRAPFTKGMLFSMDFIEFAENVARSYHVKDIWGDERNILDVDIILTESMLKLANSYKSWEDYWENTKANHSGFSVTKSAEMKQKESREYNYQFLNPLELSDDDIDELIAPTIDDLSGVCGGDIAKMAIYLCGEGMTQASVTRMPDDWVKALLIDERVKNDPYVRQKIQQLIRKRITKAKLGRLRGRGDFQIIGCDPYILLQSVFGLEPTGLLKAGEVYSKYWLDRGVDEVVLMRAPMTIINNLCKRKVSQSEAAQHWYKYLPNILLLNAWDLTAACCNGADYDGDIMLSTDDKCFVDHVHDQLAIQCEQKSATKCIVTEDAVIQSNILSFGDDIGKITNRATSLFDVRSHFPKGSKLYKEASQRLSYFQHYQQSSIDRAKGIISVPMPSYFYREKEAAKFGEDEKRLCAYRKPWFMIFRYKDIASEFNKYYKKAAIDCEVELECSIEDLLAKSDDERTAKEKKFFEWYRRNSPVSLGDCTSNRIARRIEANIDKIKNRWKDATPEFSYTIYRPDINKESYPRESYFAIKKVLDRYERELEDVPVIAKARHLDESQIAIMKESLAEAAKIDCYLACSNADELAYLILDVTYSEGKSSQIAWDLCGDVMIKTLLKRQNNIISYYERDEYGEVKYKGERYSRKSFVYEEVIDDRIE